MPDRQQPHQAPDNKSTDPPKAAPTAPLDPNVLGGFGRDEFKASAALRTSTPGVRGFEASAERVKARLEELHTELSKAKAMVFEVRPRMAILKLAVRLIERKIAEVILFQNRSPSDRLQSRQLAAHLAANPGAQRTARVALGQYDAAWNALRWVEESLVAAEMASPEEAWAKLSSLSVEKMRGQAFPLTTLYVHFEADPILSRLFPAPNPAPVAPDLGAAAEKGPTSSNPPMVASKSASARPRGTAPLDPGDLANIKAPVSETPAEGFRLGNVLKRGWQTARTWLREGPGEQ